MRTVRMRSEGLGTAVSVPVGYCEESSRRLGVRRYRHQHLNVGWGITYNAWHLYRVLCQFVNFLEVRLRPCRCVSACSLLVPQNLLVPPLLIAMLHSTCSRPHPSSVG